MSNVRRLRTTGYDDPRVAQLAQDAQQALDAIVTVRVLEFTRTYAEPMSIALDHEPLGVLLIRLREHDAPEEIVPADTLVSFTYINGQIVIPELQGPEEGVRYRFTFEVVG